MVVDTSSPHARAQYDANVAFALGYEPLRPPKSRRPRVLVTGFGRFLDNKNNASGRIVSALVPAAKYPSTTSLTPARRTSVAIGTVDLPNAGLVDICAMIVPVYWDLSSILIAKQVAAFKPSLVLMNGVAGEAQDLWIELGSVNLATTLQDGSGILRPLARAGKKTTKILSTTSVKDQSRGLLLSWNSVRSAAEKAVNAHARLTRHGERFGDLLPGVKLGGFPRSGNTYLCNNTAYLIDTLMRHPKRAVTLLEASKAVKGKPNSVRASLATDARAVPRTFMHWPSQLSGDARFIGAGAEIVKAVIDAQLTATKNGDKATVGKNANADATLGGDTF